VRENFRIMAYLSGSFDFEHVMQNSSNWDAVHKKRSFVARKMHKINKVRVVFSRIVSFFLKISRTTRVYVVGAGDFTR